MNKVNYKLTEIYHGQGEAINRILIERLKSLYSNPESIGTKFQKKRLIEYLNQQFWELGGIDEYYDEYIYHKACHAGKISHKTMLEKVDNEYTKYKESQGLISQKEALKELENDLEKMKK